LFESRQALEDLDKANKEDSKHMPTSQSQTVSGSEDKSGGDEGRVVDGMSSSSEPEPSVKQTATKLVSDAVDAAKSTAAKVTSTLSEHFPGAVDVVRTRLNRVASGVQERLSRIVEQHAQKTRQLRQGEEEEERKKKAAQDAAKAKAAEEAAKKAAKKTAEAAAARAAPTHDSELGDAANREVKIEELLDEQKKMLKQYLGRQTPPSSAEVDKMRQVMQDIAKYKKTFKHAGSTHKVNEALARRKEYLKTAVAKELCAKHRENQGEWDPIVRLFAEHKIKCPAPEADEAPASFDPLHAKTEEVLPPAQTSELKADGSETEKETETEPEREKQKETEPETFDDEERKATLDPDFDMGVSKGVLLTVPHISGDMFQKANLREDASSEETRNNIDPALHELTKDYDDWLKTEMPKENEWVGSTVTKFLKESSAQIQDIVEELGSVADTQLPKSKMQAYMLKARRARIWRMRAFYVFKTLERKKSISAALLEKLRQHFTGAQRDIIFTPSRKEYLCNDNPRRALLAQEFAQEEDACA
jgi:hypothetical protein